MDIIIRGDVSIWYWNMTPILHLSPPSRDEWDCSLSWEVNQKLTIQYCELTNSSIMDMYKMLLDTNVIVFNLDFFWGGGGGNHLNEFLSALLWLLATAKLKIRQAQAVSGSRSFDAYCVDFALTALFCAHERHKSVGSLHISFHVLQNQEIKRKKTHPAVICKHPYSRPWFGTLVGTHKLILHYCWVYGQKQVCVHVLAASAPERSSSVISHDENDSLFFITRENALGSGG